MIVARPRFSLRWVMIAFPVLGVAFYFLFVRPTVLANQFVRDIQRGDFTQVESLLGEPPRWVPLSGTIGFRESTTVASVYPRDWSDIWHCRRTIEVSLFSSGRVPIEASDNNLGRFLHGASDSNPATGLPRAVPHMYGSAAYQAGPFSIRLIRNAFPPVSPEDLEETLSIDQ